MSDTYLQQWVNTVTQGNVSFSFAWAQDRVEFRCKECHAIFRCDAPTGTTIDSKLQAWVRLHRPNGPHDKEEFKNPADVVALTADFKRLESELKAAKIQEAALEHKARMLGIDTTRRPTAKIAKGRRFR